ncbi:hypothetical protein JQX09_24315 [Sulfitobacter pseudonitzschiae]|uniref:Uncharacterized protein n=1 Tax=Pseudosulfitobacter pseudonitzschiae TaxID=1402135 RepID=A0A9Q2RZS5_9RHOB|nr:hypothetical protein [Pseudosulfitobacter pseudonitzschiae]MBM2295048.1 hypothetical protein [Pseudosulfitobacter pseudonitzschiae]MBM2299962.1 hypothetical protein [Pseudosulfitobacter pseudonitzschiae]MBM2304886.1 hypothetical protein [Pseudosulfitobacter pseudonitzschiae]MBM2314659.1 hypothetical protein [Pseudosulfitobacter pseudonitzschiae]MBM2319569.1 hypothetical protein [Pseudosulfitobacter pseudonitzschiae]
MSRSPVQSFAELKDALAQMVSLDSQMEDDKLNEEVGLVNEWDDQANRAMAAFSELMLQEDALRDIEALVATTYGGEPD